MLKDAASSAKPTKYAQNNRQGIYEGTSGQDGIYAREMQGAEDGQGDCETQIAQGDDLVQAASPRDIGLSRPQRNNEKEDTGAAHGNHRSRDPKKVARMIVCMWMPNISPRALSGHVFPGQFSFALYNEEWVWLTDHHNCWVQPPAGSFSLRSLWNISISVYRCGLLPPAPRHNIFFITVRNGAVMESEKADNRSLRPLCRGGFHEDHENSKPSNSHNRVSRRYVLCRKHTC